MKKLLLLSLFFAVGCERATPSTASQPRTNTVPVSPRPPVSEPELLDLELVPPPRANPPAKPSPPMGAPVVVTVLKPVEPPPLSPENEEAVKLAKLRLQVLNARVALQQQEALLEYVNYLETDFLEHWKPDGVESGSSVVRQMRLIQRFRDDLLKERDILRQQFVDAEKAVVAAEQHQQRRTTASK